jgi:hypothetical protein
MTQPTLQYIQDIMSVTYDSTNQMVLIQKGGQTLFRFSASRFSELEIELLRARHVCGGCVDIPTNGFKSFKPRWCSFSRKIANLEEIALGR